MDRTMKKKQLRFNFKILAKKTNKRKGLFFCLFFYPIKKQLNCCRCCKVDLFFFNIKRAYGKSKYILAYISSRTFK